MGKIKILWDAIKDGIQFEAFFFYRKDRLLLELLEKNYKRYFLGRMKEIVNYIKL
jgi:hypothetical protein